MASTFRLEDCYVKPNQQLCWNCKNACGGCSWSQKFEPIPGWVAEERVLYHRGNGIKNKTTSYSIRYCPEFEQDNLTEVL